MMWIITLQLCIQLVSFLSAANTSVSDSGDLNQQRPLNEITSHVDRYRGVKNKRDTDSFLYLNVELIIDKQFCENYRDMRPLSECAQKTVTLINSLSNESGLDHGTIYHTSPNSRSPQLVVQYPYVEVRSNDTASIQNNDSLASLRAGDINEDSLHAYAQNSKRVRKKKVDLVVFVTYSSRYSDRNIAAANALKTRGQVCDDQTPIAMVDYRHGTMLHVLWRVLGIDCTGPLQCAGTPMSDQVWYFCKLCLARVLDELLAEGKLTCLTDVRCPMARNSPCYHEGRCRARRQGRVCRPAANPCDPVETCAGGDVEECPADIFRICPPEIARITNLTATEIVTTGFLLTWYYEHPDTRVKRCQIQAASPGGMRYSGTFGNLRSIPIGYDSVRIGAYSMRLMRGNRYRVSVKCCLWLATGQGSCEYGPETHIVVATSAGQTRPSRKPDNRYLLPTILVLIGFALAIMSLAGWYTIKMRGGSINRVRPAREVLHSDDKQEMEIFSSLMIKNLDPLTFY